MGKLPVRRSPQSKSFVINELLGADLSKSGSGLSYSRSPACPNFIRNSAGQVCKWIGYRTVEQYAGRFNGAHTFVSAEGEHHLRHVGSSIYISDGTLLTNNANDRKSMSRQLAGMLCIFDGNTMWIYSKSADTYTLRPAAEVAKVPTTMITRAPSGGGTVYEQVNLLTPKRIVQFKGTGADKVYQLPSTKLDGDLITVKIINSDGTATELIEGNGFAANRETGQLTFVTAPSLPPVAGQDNVFVHYSKTNEGYLDKVYHCDICTLYGSGGGRDRLFVAGAPELGNRDNYSGYNDPTYFGDLSYGMVGGDGSYIMGYSIIGDRLATHLNRSDDDTNVVLREASQLNNETAFRLVGSYQGEGAISKHSFATLAVEPVFLSKSGIMAITMSDYSAERYAQSRSYYIDNLLCKQPLEEAHGCIFDEFYMLAAGEYIFALDCKQIDRDKNMPYATRQYSGFYRTGIGARVLWTEDDSLWFGTDGGKVCRFWKDYNQLSCFSDDGNAIAASWTTPEIYGSDFRNKKKFESIAALIGAAVATGCRIWAVYDGEKELVMDYGSTARYFSYSQFRYSKFTYKTDRTPQILMEKLSGIKPENQKVQFIIENDMKDEPFVLCEIAVDYKERR